MRGVLAPELVQRPLRLLNLHEKPKKRKQLRRRIRTKEREEEHHLSTVVTLTSWPGHGSLLLASPGAGLLIAVKSVSPCAIALRNSPARLACSRPCCSRTDCVVGTSFGSSVSWRRRENFRRAAPMSLVFAEKRSTAFARTSQKSVNHE